ncbi:MAG: YihY/virulence factor BrkB family protein [Fibrobacterota bacterium]
MMRKPSAAHTHRISFPAVFLSRIKEERVSEESAAMSFFMLFSLFPLLLAAAVIGGYFLGDDSVRATLIDAVIEFFPNASSDFIEENIQQTLQNRERIGFISIVFLVWTGTRVFVFLSNNLNRAWKIYEVSGLFKNRYIAVLIAVGLFFLLTVFSLAEVVLGYLQNINFLKDTIPFWAEIVSTTGIYIFIFFGLFTLYSLVIQAKSHTRSVFIASVSATAGIRIVTLLFSAFLESGLAKYNLVYGSLGTLISFMMWLYIMNSIIISGAHIAYVHHIRRLRKN